MIRFTRQPRRGDAVLGNLETKKEVYVRQESLNSESDIDTSKYEIIGVVVARRGRKVLIAYYKNGPYKWSDRYSFKLTGYTLDGQTHTGVLGIREASNSWASNVNYTVTYAAASVEELVEQLNAFFQDTANPVFQTQDWAARLESDGTVTLHMAFTDYRQSSCAGSGGFTLTANLLPGAVAHVNMRRKHGGTGGEGAISSWTRALAYYRADNSSTTYNPASNVTSIRTAYPVCLPAYLGQSAYQSDHCALLRQTYGEGETGWLRYMESCLPVYPTDFGNMGMTDGLERTKYLASQTYTSPKKPTATALCPAASYCYNISTTCIPKGQWFLGTTRDVAELLDGIQYGTNSSRTADPVNATLLKLGGSAISNGSIVWSSLRVSAYYAWYASGFSGFFGNGYGMYNTHLAIPLSLRELA